MRGLHANSSLTPEAKFFQQFTQPAQKLKAAPEPHRPVAGPVHLGMHLLDVTHPHLEFHYLLTLPPGSS